VFTVTHPYHPWYGQQFELLDSYQHWGAYRVTFYDALGQVRGLPAAWTSLVPPDPFVVFAHGRALFRPEDLLALSAHLQRLKLDCKEEPAC
jgi:hypothetical protein